MMTVIICTMSLLTGTITATFDNNITVSGVHVSDVSIQFHKQECTQSYSMGKNTIVYRMISRLKQTLWETNTELYGWETNTDKYN